MNLFLVSFSIGLAGVSLSIWGISWDVISHLLSMPETFFTPSHIVLYVGVGLSLISAILSSILILTKKNVRTRPIIFGAKMIIIGALMQIIAGPGDFYWHELFGIDGLLSPTHLVLLLGILTGSAGSIIGFSRIYFEMNHKNNLIKFILPISFGIFWFCAMWLIFFFVLPISQGEVHNFNPNPYVAMVLGITLLPFSFSIIFWFAARTINRFGVASMAMAVFLIMNVSSNIFTVDGLLFYLPWFGLPVIGAIIADYLLNKKTNSTFLQNHSVKISGAILGSMFFMFCFPMLSMTFLNFFNFSVILSYGIIHHSSNIIAYFWLMTIIPGINLGVIGMIFAQKKLSHLI